MKIRTVPAEPELEMPEEYYECLGRTMGEERAARARLPREPASLCALASQRGSNERPACNVRKHGYVCKPVAAAGGISCFVF